jgi:hypothetical protein
MKKLRMDLEELAVESFETVDGKKVERGTVHAHTGTGSECNTYLESCMATACCGSDWQSCDGRFCPMRPPVVE